MLPPVVNKKVIRKLSQHCALRIVSFKLTMRNAVVFLKNSLCASKKLKNNYAAQKLS